MKRRTIDPLVNRIVSDWTECVRLQKVTRIKGGKRVTTLCRNTGRPAKFLDPITSVPFASTLAFNRMRSTYYFDPSRCHESVLLEDFSTRATYASTGGNGVLLTPPASATGVSYVEFVLEVTGTHSHMHIGVCDGRFDVSGGWTALSDPDAWLYSVYNMKKVHQGAIEDFGTLSPKKGDRCGLSCPDRNLAQHRLDPKGDGRLLLLRTCSRISIFCPNPRLIQLPIDPTPD